MARNLFPAKLFQCIVPPICITRLFKGFRRGLWQPPTAHMLLPTAVNIRIPCQHLCLNLGPLLPIGMCMFMGFRCRPHLRV
jgi:hypothetical protein